MAQNGKPKFIPGATVFHEKTCTYASIYKNIINTVTTKSPKKFIEILKRSEGVSLIALIVLMVSMIVMGGVFTSIMGGWKLSAPMSINSTKAFYLAETAAMFALQDAKYRFFSAEVLTTYSGTSTRKIFDSTTEEADYWFEDEGTTADRYTLIATGKVLRGGAAVATRQIKINADITGSPPTYVKPGVHTEGTIDGHGNANNQQQINKAFDITMGTSTVTFIDGDYEIGAGDDDDIVYRPQPPIVQLDENLFKTVATDQNHNHSLSLDLGPTDDGHPEAGSYYYSGNVPNIIYVSGDLTVHGNTNVYGVYWVTGSVTISGSGRVHGIIICEGGDITLKGGGNPSAVNIDGGIIHYGANTLAATGNHVDIEINTGFFDALNNTIPDITVVSWQEAVSAN